MHMCVRAYIIFGLSSFGTETRIYVQL